MDIDLSRLLAIDPPGCGCTECIIGKRIPLNDPRIEQVIEAVLSGEISVRNNNYCTLVLYRDRHGRYGYVEVPLLDRRYDHRIISEEEVYLPQDEEEAALHLTDENVDVTVPYVPDLEDSLGRKIEDVINYNIQVVNKSGETVILYKTPYDECATTGILAPAEDVKILWYE